MYFGGLKSSFLWDKCQGIILLLLVPMSTFSVKILISALQMGKKNRGLGKPDQGHTAESSQDLNPFTTTRILNKC